nr:hypothetical protein Iba_chr02aCG9540 [Ipomoea batatas]
MFGRRSTIELTVPSAEMLDGVDEVLVELRRPLSTRQRRFLVLPNPTVDAATLLFIISSVRVMEARWPEMLWKKTEPVDDPATDEDVGGAVEFDGDGIDKSDGEPIEAGISDSSADIDDSGISTLDLALILQTAHQSSLSRRKLGYVQ